MLNITKHMEVFNPYEFKEEVHIIGAGSVGSKVGLALAKLGIEKLHIYDFDKVEAHNLANQVYRPSDVGEYKIEALKDIIEPYNNTVTYYNKKVTKDNSFRGIVYLGVDTMKSRKELWEGCIKLKLPIPFCIDTRMGKNSLNALFINPLEPSSIERYEENLFPDSDVKEVSACGFSSSVGDVSSMAAAIAVRGFINFVNTGKVSQNEVVIGLSPVFSFIVY